MENLKRFERLLLELTGERISDVEEDPTCIVYAGGSFKINAVKLICRTAKVTPKKVGKFVTLWKRSKNGETEPYHGEDPYDFYLVFAEEGEHQGFFVFPRHVLARESILTSAKGEGKRGFRVYTSWDNVNNKQAKQTKCWQSFYFIDLSTLMDENKAKYQAIISCKNC
ncbi:MepB family protein [Sphingobacterium sp. LRF_L2]|uniref:MepB family protein n=1 Tax=Sphingobacterium sp. LRF_L2 TaxID=3369421 RepID=UPI003F639422